MMMVIMMTTTTTMKKRHFSVISHQRRVEGGCIWAGCKGQIGLGVDVGCWAVDGLGKGGYTGVGVEEGGGVEGRCGHRRRLRVHHNSGIISTPGMMTSAIFFRIHDDVTCSPMTFAVAMWKSTIFQKNLKM